MPALAQSKNAAAFEVVRTEGCRVFAANGRSAIDFQSGWCVGNLGWTRPEIERALRDFDGPAYIYPHHRYAPWEELARALRHDRGLLSRQHAWSPQHRRRRDPEPVSPSCPAGAADDQATARRGAAGAGRNRAEATRRRRDDPRAGDLQPR